MCSDGQKVRLGLADTHTRTRSRGRPGCEGIRRGHVLGHLPSRGGDGGGGRGGDDDAGACRPKLTFSMLHTVSEADSTLDFGGERMVVLFLGGA